MTAVSKSRLTVPEIIEKIHTNPRKEVKTYGTRAEMEGEYQAGETAVLIDDLATTGGSKFEAIE